MEKYIKYNNKFKISAPVWKDKFKLPDESYSIYIQDYLRYIMKKHETLTYYPPVKIY